LFKPEILRGAVAAQLFLLVILILILLLAPTGRDQD
jgi:hypothetical protein